MADSVKVYIEAILKDKGFQKQMRGMATSTTKTSKIVGGFTKVLGALGLVGGLYMAVRAFKNVIKIAKDFEAGIARVASVTGKQATPALTKFAREAAVVTKFTAREAADALFFLASAGLEVSEMEKVLTPALNLATAANLEIAEATDLVVGNLKVFATEGLGAAEAVDILTKQNQMANTDVRQLGEALKMVGSTASLFEMKFSDINAVLGAFANQGIKGSMAGAKLRMTFARLAKPTGEAEEALAKYNISTKEISDLLPTPLELFKRLRDANISTSDAVKIFGVRQLAVFKLIKSGIPDIEKFQKGLENAGGAAKEAADIQLDTLEGQLKLLKSAYEEVVLSMSSGTGMIPVLKNMVKWVVEVTRKFGDWIKSSEGIKTINIVMATLGLTAQFIWNTGFKPLFVGFRMLITPLIETTKSLGAAWQALKNLDWEGLKAVSINTFDNILEKEKELVIDTVEGWKEMGSKSLEIWKMINTDYAIKQKEQTEILKEEIDKRKQLIADAAKAAAEAEAEAAAIAAENELDKKVKLEMFYIHQDNLRKEYYKKGEKDRKKDLANFGNSIKQKITASQNYINALVTIGDNWMTLEQQQLDSMDEADSAAREKQIERMKKMWKINQALKITAAVIETAAGTVKALATFPTPNYPLAALMAAAGALQVGIIAKQKMPSFASGAEMLNKDMIAQIHQGERIVPAHMNIPGISNAELMNAAFAGMDIPGNGASNVSNDNRTYSEESKTSFDGATFVLENVNDPESFVSWAENMGVNILQRA